jgi:hypothetical protein
MACHTWFYKKIPLETLSFKDMEKAVIKDKKHVLSLLKESLVAHDFDDEIERKEIIKDIKHINFLLSKINRGYLNKKRKLLKLFAETNNHYYIINNCLYSDETNYHDIFRVSDYLDTVLVNKNETLEFIKNNNCSISNIEDIDKFWNEFPDGVIDFG